MSGSEPSPTAASTVLVLRAGARGVEVFLVQRHRRSGFMPSMWVFPGGRVEPEDATLPAALRTGSAELLSGFGFDEAGACAVAVAAARETFEECGLWLGEGALPEGSRLALQAGELKLAALLSAHGARVRIDAVRPWARWVTPVGEGRRFDTAFLVAVTDGAGGRHDEVETVNSGWFRPAELWAAGMQRFPIAPPTWCVLRELASFRSVEEVVAASARRDLRPVQPIMSVRDGRPSLLLPGHPEHPEPARAALPCRLDLGEVGWQPWDQR